MFPIRDDNPTEMFPFITMGIIAVCVAVWVMLQGAGLEESALASSVCTFGAIPSEITGAARSGVVDLGNGIACRLGGVTWGALFTSMFLHGSWAHLLGNMWFFWIFGNNVEDSMGHLRFVVFYVLCGLISAGAHVLSAPDSPIPTVGASGAISAIMGAYVVLYPRARVLTVIFLIIFIRFVWLPAVVFLGVWFLLQLLSAGGPPTEGGGIAFWAHIGGFVAGVLLIFPFRNPRLVAAKRARVKLTPGQLEHGGWW